MLSLFSLSNHNIIFICLYVWFILISSYLISICSFHWNVHRVTLGIPLGYLGCPRCTPTEEALPPKGGVRKVIGFQMYKHVQNMNEIQRDSKRKENTIYLIYLIYDQPLHQGNSVFELSCFSVPINSMPVSLTGLDSESKTQIASSKGPQLFQLRGKHW